MEKATPEKIDSLIVEHEKKMSTFVQQIDDINGNAHVISINARIEAARCGGVIGKGFAVVASEFAKISNDINGMTRQIEDEMKEKMTIIKEMSGSLIHEVKGNSLSQVALSKIDVIDRNLYERSCDVRWWATESSVVEVLKNSTEESIKHSSVRLGKILDSYTVYYDIVIANNNGIIISNGRPEKYKSKNKNISTSEWFKLALKKTPDEYSMQSSHKSDLVNDKLALIYSCSVKNETTGNIIGVLGIIYKWEELSNNIIQETTKQLQINDDRKTEVVIVDEKLNIISQCTDSKVKDFFNNKTILKKESGFIIPEDTFHIVAFGYSNGFETYKSNWYVLIFEY